MGAKSRRKGALGEREVAKLLKDHGFEARRSVQYCGKADDSADITTDLPGVHIEVKRVEKFNLHTAMAQAKRDAALSKEPKMPVVFHRRSRSGWLVILDADAFLELFKVKNACKELVSRYDASKADDLSID